MVIQFGKKILNSKTLPTPLMFVFPVMLGMSSSVKASCTSNERAEMVRAGLTGAEVRDICDQKEQNDDGKANENASIEEAVSPISEKERLPNESAQNKARMKEGFGDTVGSYSIGIIRKKIENSEFSFTGLAFKGMPIVFPAIGENEKLGAYLDLLIEIQKESELDNELSDFSIGGGLAYKLQPRFIAYAGISLDARIIDRPELSEPLTGGGVGYKAGFLSKLSDQITLFGEYHILNLDDEVGDRFDRYGGGLSWTLGDIGSQIAGGGIDLSIRYNIESYEIGGKASNIIFGIGGKF